MCRHLLLFIGPSKQAPVFSSSLEPYGANSPQMITRSSLLNFLFRVFIHMNLEILVVGFAARSAPSENKISIIQLFSLTNAGTHSSLSTRTRLQCRLVNLWTAWCIYQPNIVCECSKTFSNVQEHLQTCRKGFCSHCLSNIYDQLFSNIRQSSQHGTRVIKTFHLCCVDSDTIRNRETPLEEKNAECGNLRL